MNTKSWKDIKDDVLRGEGRFKEGRIGSGDGALQNRIAPSKAREEKNLTQEQLAELLDKKRTYISRAEKREQSDFEDFI